MFLQLQRQMHIEMENDRAGMKNVVDDKSSS